MPPSCFICSGDSFDHVTPEYRRCRGCGHELLAASDTQAFIVNDALRRETIERDSFLDRFQGRVLDHAVSASGGSPGQLVDIGSGAGKFLHRHGPKFERASGIEITPEAVKFSQNVLGLTIVGDISEVNGEIGVATAWHSLEHFPPSALQSLLAALAAKLSPRGCVIVSVPNAASLQYRWFRRRYAFFDVPSHLHQFTPESLERLFAAHGFTRSQTMISWPYNVFGYMQALLNCAMPGHNYLYYRLKRGWPRASVARDVAGCALLPLVAPLGFALALIDALLPRRQGVLTWCFRRQA